MRIAALPTSILLLSLGCATSFEVHEVAVDCTSDSKHCAKWLAPDRPPELETPDGVVVNARAVYTSQVTWTNESGTREKLDGDAVVAVDARRVLLVNMCRQPFADGELQLDLNSAQQIERISVSGTTPVPAAAQAAQKAMEFRKELLEAKKKKAEEDGSGAGASGE